MIRSGYYHIIPENDFKKRTKGDGVMNKELAVVVSNDNEGVSVFETVDAIKKAGFRNVFVQWYDSPWEISQEEQLAYIGNAGLNVIFAHLGYQNINDIWREDEAGDRLVERYMNDIANCRKNGIPMVVIHVSSKSKAPAYGETGIGRLKRLAGYAESMNMKIAFENNKIKGYPDYVLENLTGANVGLCFDVGHWHAHFNDELDFEKFRNRIFAVHLHDNFGKDDEHLMPFDGTVDWHYAMSKIADCGYDGPITLEICYHGKYTGEPLEDFYKRGFEIGERLAGITSGEE